jgi:ABC-type amino acid transport substrate-binding protein
MKRKIALLLGVIMMLLLTLSAIGVAQAQSLLDEVVKRKVVKVGVCLDAPPYSWKKADGSFDGIDIELANMLAKTLKVDLELQGINTIARVPMLVSKKIDVVICGFTRTLERSLSIDFTEPYAVIGAVLLVNPSDPRSAEIKSYKDLKGKPVGGTMGGTSWIALQKVAPEANMSSYKTIADTHQALVTQKIVAMPTDSVMGYEQQRMEPKNFKVVGDFFTVEDICFGVPKGDQIWLNWLNLFLHQNQIEGKIAPLYEKWFKSPAPKYTGRY